MFFQKEPFAEAGIRRRDPPRAIVKKHFALIRLVKLARSAFGAGNRYRPFRRRRAARAANRNQAIPDSLGGIVFGANHQLRSAVHGVRRRAQVEEHIRAIVEKQDCRRGGCQIFFFDNNGFIFSLVRERVDAHEKQLACPLHCDSRRGPGVGSIDFEVLPKPGGGIALVKRIARVRAQALPFCVKRKRLLDASTARLMPPVAFSTPIIVNAVDSSVQVVVGSPSR